MPNYFDYISESAERYDEPDFVEESVNDSFNETIADMDLHCFQEGLGTVAAVLGAAAILGLLIALIHKIVNSLSSSTKTAKKAMDKAQKAGYTAIVSDPDAKSHHNNSGSEDNGGNNDNASAQASAPKSNEPRVIHSPYKIEVVDTRKEKFRSAYSQITQFFRTAQRFFDKYSDLDPSEYKNGAFESKLYNSSEYNDIISNRLLKPVPKSLDGLLAYKPKWDLGELQMIFESLEKYIKEFKDIESELKETKIQVESTRGQDDMFIEDHSKRFQANVAKISAFSTMLDNDLHITCKDIYGAVKANAGYGKGVMIGGKNELKGKTR